MTARYFIAQWVDDDDGWSIAVATSAREALGETCSLIDEHAECRRDVEPRSFAQLMRALVAALEAAPRREVSP